LRRLFRESEDRERELDKQDVYAAPTALGRPKLARVTTKILGLRAGDPFGRRWLNSLGVDLFSGEAWGVEREGGDDNGGRSGHRLRVRVGSLLTFLTLVRRHLVLLVRVEKYLKDESRTSGRRHRHGDRFIPFRTQTLVVIISPAKGVRIVRRIPKSVRDAVKRMSDTDRHDFRARLKAIVRSRSMK